MTRVFWGIFLCGIATLATAILAFAVHATFPEKLENGHYKLSLYKQIDCNVTVIIDDVKQTTFPTILTNAAHEIRWHDEPRCNLEQGSLSVDLAEKEVRKKGYLCHEDE